MSLTTVIRMLGWKLLLTSLISLTIGISIGANFFSVPPQRDVYRRPGILTRPLLGFEFDTRGEFDELNTMEKRLREFIAEQKRAGAVQTASAYVRLLNSGRWFSIEPDELFSPASLLKIPVMMAYYKKAEDNPSTLKNRIFNDGTFAFDEQSTIPLDRRLEKGKTYSVEDLIGRMIRDSNNEAKDLLESALPRDFVTTMYDEMHVEDPYAHAGDFMSVSGYPLFLRVLYNASYLNEKYSEAALQLLTRSSFTEGLPAHLPPEIKVAHKFGFRTADGIAELHDCGIVYYPDHPYILCVMTKGHAFNTLLSFIQDFALLTYKEMDEFHKSE